MRKTGLAYRWRKEVAGGAVTMNPTKGNGPEAARNRPAKTLTKYTANFTARAASFATADSGYLVLCVVVVVQVVLLALVEVLQ